jgi:hypothetical protein
MDSAAMKRCAAFGARRADLVACGAEVLGGVEETGGGDDVLARSKQPAHRRDVHDDRGVEHAVGVSGDYRADVVGGDDADRFDAGDLAGVLADLVLAVDQDTDEVERRASGEMADTGLADVSGHPLDHTVGLVRHCFPVSIRRRRHYVVVD